MIIRLKLLKETLADHYLDDAQHVIELRGKNVVSKISLQSKNESLTWRKGSLA
jgi:hypothetical protein